MSMADGDVLRARAAVRDQALHTLVDVLKANDRIVAAWLGGSISQDAGDALSDLDLTVVVTAAASAALCARPWQLAGRTTPDRLALFARIGHPAIIHENQHNAPSGGSFTCVIYESGVTVDWILLPQDGAARPPDTHLLFAKVDLPVQTPPAPLSIEQRAERASERVAFFWMMASIAVKYAVRGDVVYVHHLSLGLNNLVREVRELVTGVPAGYQRGSLIGAVVPLGDPSAAIQGLCAAMFALTPDLVALGGTVPPNPMHVVDALLALAHETP